MEKTFLEFFAGIGLMRIGLEKEGWKCLFANDNDIEKVKTYTMNFGIDCIDDKNIEDLKARDLPAATLATASFPCQDLSEAGPRQGIYGPRSGVFWEFIRILREMNASRPSLVLLENVKGFLTDREGHNLTLAVSALNQLGYSCDVLIVDGKYFVPQSRPRVFVVGITQDIVADLELSYASMSTREQEHPFRPTRILRLISDSRNLGWFRLKLPSISSQNLKLEHVLDPPEKVPPSYWFSEEETKRHLVMMPDYHRRRVESLLLQSQNAAMTMYRRMRKNEQKAELRFDGNAGCLRSARGGSSKQFVVIVDRGKLRIRKLTIPEIRRLMGVPDGFLLPTGYNTAYRALGDAVVVPAVEWVAKNALDPLFERISQSAIKIYG